MDQTRSLDNDHPVESPGQRIPAAGPSGMDAMLSQPSKAADGSQVSTMQTTLLRQFGLRFDQCLRPLLRPLAKAVDSLADADWQTNTPEVLSPLRELAHDLQALVDKVAQQHAYVLIFGPLKSGKSTFMNALCGSYVSQVTSLPAYPCLVHVCHDRHPGFTVTRYDCSTEQFDDAAGLHQAVEAAHQALVQRIRRVERHGAEFDPDTHMPEAIRKIDVKVTAGDLDQSGAVLVDTPGLYTRMKFGYDRMTRQFRNAAACAIFIVKADNLFLEQVFDEFHELLGLFSRIFLIINIDSAKKDLGPDGQLVPSLEHRDPGRIIKAFEDLSMSVGLKAAADAGRLKMYPVDLLSAASRRLRGDSNHGARSAHTGQADFNALLGDLTQYLNSSEYLRALMSDSLCRAQTLLEQIHRAVGQSQRTELANRVALLGQQRESAQLQKRAVGRLRDLDWRQQALSLRAPMYADLRQQAQQIQRTTGDALVNAVDVWFQTDHSLEQLNDVGIRPLLTKVQAESLAQLHRWMQRRFAGVSEALKLSPAVVGDLLTSQIDLDATTKLAMQQVRPQERITPPAATLVGRDIAVCRRWWDWLLLRSKHSVADRLFGPPGHSTRSIAVAVKAKRLGDAGRDMMKKLATEKLGQMVSDIVDQLPEQLFVDYTTKLTDQLTQVLRDKAEEASQVLDDLDRQLAQAQQVLSDLTSLQHCSQRTHDAVRGLAKQFGGNRQVDEDAVASIPDANARPDHMPKDIDDSVVIVTKPTDAPVPADPS